MLGVYTLLEAGEQGWGSTQTLVLGAIAIALLAAFVFRQARIENPLMPLRLFRSRNVTGANLVMGLLVVGFFGSSSSAPSTCRTSSATARSRSASRSFPSCIVMGTLSLGYAEKLIMGFGARPRADHRARASPRPGSRGWRARRSTASYLHRRPAGDGAARHRRGHRASRR